MRRKASITIESAIVIPFVFISILLIYSLMSYLYTDYRISKASTEAAIEFSYDSYLLYYFDISDIMAHYSYQRQSLKPKDIVELEQKTGSFSNRVTKGKVKSIEELVSGFREVANLSKSIIDKASKLPKEIGQLGTNEATVFISRMAFDQYFKAKIINYLSDYSNFKTNHLQIKLGQYFYDKKASIFYVVYDYEFPIRFPFLKNAEIIKPIYIESYIGNIIRYDGRKYKEKKEDEEEKIVYVTEKGTKYHTYRECYTIYSEPVKINIETLKNGKYEECKVCKKNHYVFDKFVYKTKSSRVYHANPNCYTINKKVKAIPLSEAKKKYSKCKVCEKLEKNLK